ncbi:31949_t:CDS:2, partial [Racocetra persica]
CNSYSIEQKKQVVVYAKENKKNKAAAAFKLDPIGSGQKEFYPRAEKRLYDWIIEQRKKGLGISYKIAHIKMLNILKEPDIIILYRNLVNNFKTSNR